MMGLNELPAYVTICLVEIEATRLAQIAVGLFGLVRQFAISFYPLMFAQASQVFDVQSNLIVFP